MRTLAASIVAIALVGSGSAAHAQEVQWTYRARVTFEQESVRAGGRRFDSHVIVSSADAGVEKGRFTFGGALIASGPFNDAWRAAAREAFTRVSVAPWLDIEAGKRLIRWGVGYGFSPTGVIDPPRHAVDPTDRLGRQEGRTMIRADIFHRDSSFTIAAASGGLVAMRARTMLPAGVEVSMIGAMTSAGRGSAGASLTHVAGQRLEFHGEFMAGRTVSGVAGLQYTTAGINVVVEYHRRGEASGARPVNNAFVRAARAGEDLKIAPELIVIRSMDNQSITAVAGVGWNLRSRLQIYGRATITNLPQHVELFNLGATLRF